VNLLPLLIPVLIVTVFLARQATYVVTERDQAIITQVGRYLRTSQAPGLHFKVPFYETAHHFDRRILLSDSTPAEYLTLDKKRLAIDHVVRWRIQDPHMFFITVRDEVGARARLDDIVVSELRRDVANHDFADIIGKQREPIMETVARRASDKSKAFGIDVVDVRIKRADLPEEVQASVFGRMVAERSRIASRYRSEGEEEAAKIRAEADKERTIILAHAYEINQVMRGEGDGQAAAIYAEAFSQSPEFYAFVRSLEAYEKSLREGGTVVLSTDSPFFRYLNGGVRR
jgi:modulator of FtsH protease HflC